MVMTVTRSTGAQTCRSDAGVLIDLAKATAATETVADTQLGELLSDEASEMADALANCARGEPDTAVLSKLATIHTEIDIRLQSDGVRW